MHGEHPSADILQRYFDAELAAAEAAQVQAHAASCATCTKQLGKLQRLRELIATSVQDSAQHVDFDAMFANIERGVATQPAPAKKVTTVVDFVSHRVQRLSHAVPVLGALALAAAVMLMLYRPEAPPNTGNEEPYELTAGNAHSEVVAVDFGGNAGTVFDISLSDGSSSPVVWIDDNDEDEDEAVPDNEHPE
jgi:anti-sigma factor RsiW